MIDLVKKTVLAGIGTASLSKEKIQESLGELVELGKMTKQEAEVMSEKIVSEGKGEAEKAKFEAGNLIEDMMRKANLVTKTEYEALEARVTELEGLLHKHFPNTDNL